jgi:RNA polymerase sigma-70 factor (ECF subfamily)
MKTNFSNSTDMTSGYPYELIEECKRGDQKAQLQIYKLYYRQIFSICTQITSDRDVAEELMQESFLLAFENINTYIRNLSFSSWIMTFIKDALKHGDNN